MKLINHQLNELKKLSLTADLSNVPSKSIWGLIILFWLINNF